MIPNEEQAYLAIRRQEIIAITSALLASGHYTCLQEVRGEDGEREYEPRLKKWEDHAYPEEAESWAKYPTHVVTDAMRILDEISLAMKATYPQA